jgi:hypothetical protein
MAPRRRDRKIPDLVVEREMLRKRDRQVPDPVVEREMRELHARIDAMETTQRCTVDVVDISEAESENEYGN